MILDWTQDSLTGNCFSAEVNYAVQFWNIFISVENLTLAGVNSYREIDSKINEGTRNRTVAATNMNATSRFVKNYYPPHMMSPPTKMPGQIWVQTFWHPYAGFPRALENLENLENHKKKFHAWKNHGIWKKLKNHGKIMEFREIICVFDCLFSGCWWFKFLILFQNACLVHNRACTCCAWYFIVRYM